ncbi:hypothetical protein NT2_04_04590 [Caenibius tardaugens NBRC 16725]|uniref:Lipoprotein n=1 Tax=Caenibius tardaugens NBRC 16725 TaxID=1219035 RepID=U2Y772_9SPHN|nr:hypothetical protein [Caenibius tardaugens]AZI35907.1 hypothetical protein EGO55_07995 [Caenibius tardaugens NBRC 16725]GAD49046.1 hypothetical protein NT2_04_04590 [Caenibius tardaugens NBRC 16725]
MKRLRVFFIVPIMLAAACGGKAEPGVYDLPLSEAYARLAKADIMGFRKARQCGILIHFETTRKRDESITWRVISNGRTMVNFTVSLTDTGDGRTRATLTMPADPQGGEPYDGTKNYPRPALNQPLRPAVQELIDAAMEGRPYDVMRLPEPRNTDRVCSVQRGGLESGSFRFGIDDKPGMDSRQSARAFADEEQSADRAVFDASYGQPENHTWSGE